MFYPGFGFPLPAGTFEQSYRALPFSFADKSHLENGDKVIMPPSALDRLAHLRIDYPMVFEIRNPSLNRVSHCGVLEFTAEEGIIYMPYWMMQNLLLQVEDIVSLKSATLLKGTYVKLQPHTKDFLDISNPKAVLETTLRNFSCLTTGDNIMVAYNNKKYYIDIVETKPSTAISIIETDCEVDFAPPLDYKEPERKIEPPPSILPSSSTPSSTPQTDQQEANETSEPAFKPFVGSGRRLDGRPSKFSSSASPLPSSSPSPSSSSSSSSHILNKSTPEASASKVQSKPISSDKNAPAAESTKKPSGGLVFSSSTSKPETNGLNSNGKSQEKSEPKTEPSEPQQPKFQPFSGKKYSLRD